MKADLPHFLLLLLTVSYARHLPPHLEEVGKLLLHPILDVESFLDLLPVVLLRRLLLGSGSLLGLHSLRELDVRRRLSHYLPVGHEQRSRYICREKRTDFSDFCRRRCVSHAHFLVLLCARTLVPMATTDYNNTVWCALFGILHHRSFCADV